MEPAFGECYGMMTKWRNVDEIMKMPDMGGTGEPQKKLQLRPANRDYKEWTLIEFSYSVPPLHSDNILPTGEKAIEGFSITLDKVDRHQAGVYQCTASNGVGDPVTVDMQLDVLWKKDFVIAAFVVSSHSFLAFVCMYPAFGECYGMMTKWRNVDEIMKMPNMGNGRTPKTSTPTSE
ncbi:hypothetical protein ANN_09391 [Periplaneta americana]|uniref:Ig-like domain-containing protein n=1 Tax=Periplaneta americana TaxID=6978 RepID=A0ABQ8TL98_PERAM|nr:hypothetical protein ANN_09391 [Periplaneta americana]